MWSRMFRCAIRAMSQAWLSEHSHLMLMPSSSMAMSRRWPGSVGAGQAPDIVAAILGETLAEGVQLLSLAINPPMSWEAQCLRFTRNHPDPDQGCSCATHSVSFHIAA